MFSIITNIKICNSISPKTFSWKGSTYAIMLVTEERIIIGYKRLLFHHFEEILPQFIKKCYKRNLLNIQSLCITTKQGALAVEIPELNSVDAGRDAVLSILGKVSEYSDNVKGYPARDKYDHRLLALYSVPVTGIDKAYNGQSAQPYVDMLSLGDKVQLIPNEKNETVQVCNADKIALGWIDRMNIDTDIDYYQRMNDLIYRLTNDITVIATFKSKQAIHCNKPGFTIEIARYAAR